MVSGRFKCITLIVHLFIYIHYHYISSTSDHQPLDMGNWGPVLYGMFSLVIYFIYVHSINSVYMSIKSPNSSHHPLSPLRSICLFSMSGSLFLFCKQDYLYHFSRFHIYALKRNLFFSFFLTSLYMTDSRSIHVSTNDPISFLFMSDK